MREPMTRGEWTMLLAGTAAAAAVLGAAGRFAPWLSPDTAVYLSVPPLPEGWGFPRHPLFGWILHALPGRDHAALPPLQTGLFLAATLFLHHALRDYGLSRRAAGSVSAALLSSNLLVLWHASVHPEVLAATSWVAAIAATVRLAAERSFALNALAAAVLLGLAYVLRPSLLPAIVALPLLYAALARLEGGRAIGRRAAALGLLLALPFLLNGGIRWRAVGDFNIVSFGGYQMSGMAGLMLTPDILEELPEDLRSLGRAVLDARIAAERAGDVIATPRNSRGERSFASTAIGYYDLYARTYDDLLQPRIGPLRGTEDWVSFNARLMRLSLATVRAAPERYAAWVVGGWIRFTGRILAANAGFVVAAAAFLLLFAAALWRRRLPLVGSAMPADVPVLVALAVLTTGAAGALTVLTTFPAGRYLDTAGLFLPALPLYGALCLVAALRTGSR